jgi:hypothetical protein
MGYLGLAIEAVAVAVAALPSAVPVPDKDS